MTIKAQKAWKQSPNNVFFRCKSGYVICSEALDMLDSLNDESAGIIFLDPPFNLGKQYE